MLLRPEAAMMNLEGGGSCKGKRRTHGEAQRVDMTVQTVQTAGTRKEVLKHKRGSDPCAYRTSLSSAELMTFPSASATLYV